MRWFTPRHNGVVMRLWGAYWLCNMVANEDVVWWFGPQSTAAPLMPPLSWLNELPPPANWEVCLIHLILRPVCFSYLRHNQDAWTWYSSILKNGIFIFKQIVFLSGLIFSWDCQRDVSLSPSPNHVIYSWSSSAQVWIFKGDLSCSLAWARSAFCSFS